MCAARSSMLVSLLLVAGCGDDFLPPSVLAELRVLAVEATPLEAGPGDRVSLRPIVHVPLGETLVEAQWTFCPFTLGSSNGYRCVVPQCETPLGPEPDGTIGADPVALALACAAALPGEPPAVTPPLESVFVGRHRSSAGLERQTALRFPLWPTSPPPARNRPPAIAEVTLDGEALVAGRPFRAVAAGAQPELRVRVDPASLDAFVDQAGRQRNEEPLVSFFTTAGRFSADLEAGVDVRVSWKLEELDPAAREAQLYVVVRDGRGGQRAAGPFTVPVAHP